MSAHRPLVSVVIPTQRRPALLGRAIASVLSQTYRNVEAIVVDDAGKNPVANKGRDDRVRVIRLEESRGSNNARNRGLESARGHWITFLDDDDELLPHMVEESVRAACNSTLPPPVTVVTAMELVDPSGSVIDIARLPIDLPKGRHYFLDDASLDQGFAASNAFLVERRLFLAMGGWDPEIDVWHHDDIYLRLNAISSLQAINRVGYRLHVHAGARLSRDLLGGAIGMERTEAKHRNLFRQFPHRHAHYLGAAGVYYLRSGKWGAAVRATTKGLLRDLGQARLWRWWAASLAGPGALSVYRAFRRRRETSSAGSADE